MSKRLLLALCFGVVLVSPAISQDRPEKKVLKNSDVLLMVHNHFDDETLTKIIEVSETDFDLSPGALIALKNQGASSAVLRAMLGATQKKRAASQLPTTPAPTSTPEKASTSTLQAPAPVSADKKTEQPELSARPAAEASAPTPSGSAAAATAPASVASPIGISPQQLAAMESQMAGVGTMGMGSMGAMGNMFGGMFAMNYPPEQMPHVFLKAESGKQEITPSTAQIGQSKYMGGMGAGGTALRSLATEGLSFAAMGAGPAGMMAVSVFSMGSGFMPGMRPGAPKMTYVWGLPGRKSAREIDNKDPIFEINYGDIPGVDPDAYEPAVLRLVQSKDNYRLVGATQIKMDTKHMMAGGGPETGKWISEDRWPTRVDKEERGFYVLRVNQLLQPGEYAVVLRPLKGYKASPSGLGGHAQVFYSVWDFSVPGVVLEEGKKKKKN
jgi:hypothetical protein